MFEGPFSVIFYSISRPPPTHNALWWVFAPVLQHGPPAKDNAFHCLPAALRDSMALLITTALKGDNVRQVGDTLPGGRSGGGADQRSLLTSRSGHHDLRKGPCPLQLMLRGRRWATRTRASMVGVSRAGVQSRGGGTQFKGGYQL